MVRSTSAGVVCMCAAAVLAAACQRTHPVDAGKLPEPLRLEAGPATPADAKPLPQARPTASKRGPSNPAPAKRPASKGPALEAAPVAASLVIAPAADIEKTAPQSDHRPVSEATDKRGDGEDEPIVTTISGCLERNRSTFRLTDMIGEHAPKSRSWKTGFFRKGSAKLDLIDETNRLKLAPHVGYRVDVTGALFKKAMHAHSLTPTSSKCS